MRRLSAGCAGRSRGATSWPMRSASRSAPSRYARRWRGSRPLRSSSAATRAVRSAAPSNRSSPSMMPLAISSSSSGRSRPLACASSLRSSAISVSRPAGSREPDGVPAWVLVCSEDGDSPLPFTSMSTGSPASRRDSSSLMTLSGRVPVALCGEHVAQPLDVVGAELPVAGLGTTRPYEPLRLEEPDLGDRDVVELLLEPVQDFADGVPLSRHARRPVPRRDLRDRRGGSVRSGSRRHRPGGGCRLAPPAT